MNLLDYDIKKTTSEIESRLHQLKDDEFWMRGRRESTVAIDSLIDFYRGCLLRVENKDEYIRYVSKYHYYDTVVIF